MSKIRTTATLSLLAAMLSVPAVVQANSLWHPAPGEQGFTFHPDHSTSTKTRAEVLRELEQAKADGSYFYLQRGLPVPSRVSVVVLPSGSSWRASRPALSKISRSWFGWRSVYSWVVLS